MTNTSHVTSMSGSAISQSHLTNPLATSVQLSSSASQLDGVPASLERSILFGGGLLAQEAGILLRLPQDIIARAVVIFQRFWVGADGGSLRSYSAELVSAACLYLTAKLSAVPQSPRNVLNVYAYLLAQRQDGLDQGQEQQPPSDMEPYTLSESAYLTRRKALLQTETHVLRILGFETHVALPYTLAINYLQALDVYNNGAAQAQTTTDLSRRTIAHLTAALFSPQLLYLTQQPPVLATAAIYLAAREMGVKLPSDEQWWVVFDVEREELGFVVVALLSMNAWARGEWGMWKGRGRSLPLTVDAIEDEILRTRTETERGEREDLEP